MDDAVVEVVLCESLSLHMRQYMTGYAQTAFGGRVKFIEGQALSLQFQRPDHAETFASVFQVFIKSIEVSDAEDQSHQ